MGTGSVGNVLARRPSCVNRGDQFSHCLLRNTAGNIVTESRVAHLVDEEHGEQRSLGLGVDLDDKYLDIETDGGEPVCNPSRYAHIQTSGGTHEYRIASCRNPRHVSSRIPCCILRSCGNLHEAKTKRPPESRASLI